MKLFATLSTLAVATALSVATAQAADHRVDIINKTGQTLTHFYASTSDTDDWEEDILGRDTLDNGETVEVDIDDGTGKCVFDFKAVFEGGQSLVKKGINVCKVSSFTYTK
jgi:opacity protein-like surface antigen